MGHRHCVPCQSRTQRLDRNGASAYGKCPPKPRALSRFRGPDGWFAIGVGTKRQWLVLVEALGLDAPDSWGENSVRIAEREKVEALVQSAVKQHARIDLEVMLSGIPCAPVNTVNEALQDKQSVARGVLDEYQGVTTLASPLRFIQASNENSEV